MQTYWFDVFTAQTWEEARTIGFSVTGFSASKRSVVNRVQPGDILICYLKVKKRLVGVLRATGPAYSAEEPRIWASQVFPVRLPVEPVTILSDNQSVDFMEILPNLGFWHPENLRKSFARLQGSPTQLTQEDGSLLEAAIQAAEVGAKSELTVPRVIEESVVSFIPAQTSANVTSIVALDSPLEAISRELRVAQRQAGEPARFERVVADAFLMLGFDVQHIGRSGTTDVVVDSRLGHDSFRVIVDSKSSGTGRISESQINWAALSDHRQKANSDHVVIVGEQFAGGNLLRFSSEYGVGLVETNVLVELLELHHRTPFAASDLRALFASPGLAPEVVADLRQKSQTYQRHWQLIAEVIRLVDGFSRQIPPIAPTLGHLQGALFAALLADSDGSAPMQSSPSDLDIRDALAFLSSRAVGVLRSIDPAEVTGYRLTLSPRAALQRLRALEAAISEFNLPVPGTSSPVQGVSRIS